MVSRRGEMMSPCVNICVMDATIGLCAGCGRTLAEIENWTRYTNAERRAVMKALPGRVAALGRRETTEAER